MSFGRPYILNIDGAIHDGWLLLSNFQKNFNIIFLRSYLESDYCKKQYLKAAAGGVVSNLNKNLVKNVRIYYPELEEQEKIASFIEIYCKKVEILECKLQALKKYKTGILQKAEKSCKCIELSEILLERNEKTKENNQHQILSSTNSGIFLQSDYFNHQVASTNNIGYKIVKYGDIILSPQNLWLGNINLNNKFDIGCVSPSYKIYDIVSNIESDYLIEYLRSPMMLYKYKLISEQGASVVRRNLNVSEFLKLRIKLPSYELQKSIGLINQKINVLETALSLLNKIKTNLLRNMFI